MKKIIISGLLLCGFAASAQVKVGTNPTNINASAELEVESINKGFLPPRMTTAQRNAIAGPAIGLMIYNTTTNCINYFEGTRWVENCVTTAPSGADFSQAPAEPYGSTQPEAFSGLFVCEGAVISVTPCSKVPGAVLNDDTDTPLGKEYDWSGNANSQWMQSGATRALVEINGQCWYRRNADNVPTSTDPAVGHIKHSNSSDQNNWGRLYNKPGYLNGSPAEQRTQGICAPGFHVPSQCEFHFLEHSLGTSNMELGTTAPHTIRGKAQGVGLKLASVGVIPGANNASGFSAVMSGIGQPDQSITPTSFHMYGSNHAASPYRYFSESSEGGVAVSATNTGYYMAVRCLKD